nr:DUF4382 domain-containing protein [Cytophagales bacterium]
MNNSLYAALIATLLTATSCFSEKETNMDENAVVELYLIDSPADFEEVWVEVLGVELLSKGADGGNAAAWIAIPYVAEEQQVNLLELTGGNSLKLGEMELPAGEIAQLRLKLGGNNYLVKDNVESQLSTTSAQQEGLTVSVDRILHAGASHDIVIDFDVARSLVHGANVGQYFLRPLIRVLEAKYATIDGVALPQDAGPVAVKAVTGQDTTGTYVDANGYFKIQGLKEASYIIVVTPNRSFAPYISEPLTTKMEETTSVGSIELERLEEPAD